jgi:hypothetical protein
VPKIFLLNDHRNDGDSGEVARRGCVLISDATALTRFLFCYVGCCYTVVVVVIVAFKTEAGLMVFHHWQMACMVVKVWPVVKMSRTVDFRHAVVLVAKVYYYFSANVG